MLWEGQVIDGRNRIAACALAGVEPRVRTLPSCPDPVAFVLSLNLHRRHLDESQRGIVAAKARALFAEQAKARQVAAGAHGAEGGRGKVKGDQETLSANLREASTKGKAADQAAVMLNVSPRTVEAASKVLKHGVPELVEAVERGQVAVSAAAVVASLPAEEQREAVAGAHTGLPPSPGRHPHPNSRPPRRPRTPWPSWPRRWPRCAPSPPAGTDP